MFTIIEGDLCLTVFCGRFVVEKITFNTLGKCAASLSRDVERRKFQLKPIYNDWVACFVG